jgi:hypothetical protein
MEKNEKNSINPLTERESRNIIQKNISGAPDPEKGRAAGGPEGGREVWLRSGTRSCARISAAGECVAAGQRLGSAFAARPPAAAFKAVPFAFTALPLKKQRLVSFVPGAFYKACRAFLYPFSVRIKTI